jgi:hypothetical protein
LIRISYYYDQFEYPDLTYTTPGPSRGNDFYILVENKVSNKLQIDIRYKRKESPQGSDCNDIFGRSIEGISACRHENYRLISEFASSPKLRLVSKLEWSKVTYMANQINEDGYALSQSLRWNLSAFTTLVGRINIFETDSYESRILEMENDLPHNFENTVLYGRGLHWCLVFSLKFSFKVDLAAKYSQIIRDGVRSIGTGLDEIDGDTRTVVSIQLDAHF